MTKHHWRQQIKSIFKSHADPDNYERLEQTRKEMEEKNDKIMKLIKEDGSNQRRDILEELMKDYHKQFESLYDVHLNLTQQLNTDLHGKDEDKSSSDSDSDSDKNHSSSSSSKVSYAKLEKENAELRSRVMDLELNLRSMETKANESNDDMIIKLQTTIDALKREIEMEKDELTTIEEKNRNLEVMLRLSNQKTRVTEQLLHDMETTHKIVQDKNLALKRSLGEYDAMIKGIAKQLNDSLGEVEIGIRKKFDEDNGELVKSVIRLLEEVESLKGWIKDLKLEKKVEEDEKIRALGEEKREVIRQLCVWSEYCRTKTLT